MRYFRHFEHSQHVDGSEQAARLLARVNRQLHRLHTASGAIELTELACRIEELADHISALSVLDRRAGRLEAATNAVAVSEAFYTIATAMKSTPITTERDQ